MPTVHMKNGKVLQIVLDELEDFLLSNQGAIQIRTVYRRGKVRIFGKD